MVKNEYGHTGKVIEINQPDEAVVKVFNYGIENDIDYCSLKACTLLTQDEITEFFET